MSERKFDLADAYAVRRRQASAGRQVADKPDETINETNELDVSLSAEEPVADIEPEPEMSRVQQIIKRMRSQGLR